MINLLDILFPKRCLYCKKYGEYVCQECFNKLNNKYIFKKVYNDYFDYIICGSLYKGITRTQIHTFKFHENAYFYQYFIGLILRNDNIYNFLKGFDLITYVPMNYNKELRRGYNQSKLLAKELGIKLNIKVLNTLEKKVQNLIQGTLSEKERVKNVENVFSFIENVNIDYKNIILVDDILTTGSTVRVNSKLLKQNNANKICVLTIAKT